MRLQDGVVATTSGDMRKGGKFRADLQVTGERGTMFVSNPLIPQIGHQIIVQADGATRKEVFDRRSTYGYQLDAFLDAVNHGVKPATDAEDGVRQMRVIDQCYRVAGLPLRGL